MFSVVTPRGTVLTETRACARSGTGSAAGPVTSSYPTAVRIKSKAVNAPRLSAKRALSSSRSLRVQQRLAYSRVNDTVRCVLTPHPPSSSDSQGEGDENKKAHTWARITKGGVETASDLWEAASGARRKLEAAEWEGREDRPVKKVPLSDVLYSPKRHKLFNREWSSEDLIYSSFLLVTHLGCLAAPFCFSWFNVGLMAAGWVVTGMLGICLSFHRQLAHKSFTTPKWLEYFLAYCGSLAVQGDPIEWISSHRYHHLNCDTPLDPHTPYEGFWWSHAGWFLDSKATLERVGDRSNANDLAAQPFYRHMQKHYGLHVLASAAAIFAIWGFGGLVWGFCMRACFVYHCTWFVNSAAHVWGNQPYNTGDLSRNNWWVALLTFGEGWHNNHHAFEYSARHGLEWWQFDPTWMTIRALQFVGLADKVKLPTQAAKDKLDVTKIKPRPASA
mmetsp:Transcript_6144/g.7034  ORF Transcript_6144/g.7034 Transcript_6144/m.7034 type:complete len:445 (+) Transcript_6144:77-1411(+)|eukprot:CAMPEP_0197848064 /NCGR_PEP_ID=MMETSP1438-20131217/7903_1 /TAXON_ID=1461541 /ORGANISM="Pterosperma sp., Strain CCMP1384" /LENGTH=444 /DNA_ID=CAMNT_0043460191 /DNA_START=77 /DNA_END=1411 /DNA_ORIENTATION=+